jgi:hypothetical protein
MSTTNMVSLEVSATKTAFEVPMSNRLQRRNVSDLTDWLPIFTGCRNRELRRILVVLELEATLLSKHAALRPAD